ncbi:hypothetical protein BU26DRAFT_557414 [Trematosphaeria pertusa]|uniref:Uncharacterized protein n=1 Tax=Trematosphaeria pertusa TaxID=390896 RepID=A0A6A6J0A4_9PLEO|nr:uncharacterized protein BU26DRAFT_557414 [Trematosphaeria pertusa]KAF2255928.1 hypothetical protein BU26DRAFT_557414 [Trematosphaeria pertusa]
MDKRHSSQAQWDRAIADQSPPSASASVQHYTTEQQPCAPCRQRMARFSSAASTTTTTTNDNNNIQETAEAFSHLTVRESKQEQAQEKFLRQLQIFAREKTGSYADIFRDAIREETRGKKNNKKERKNGGK